MLFLDGTENVQVPDQLVRETLQLGMENGMFLNAHPSIARVTYVETNANNMLPTTSPMEDDSNASDDRLQREGESADTSLVLPLVLASVACLIVAAGVFVFRRYAKG